MQFAHLGCRCRADRRDARAAQIAQILKSFENVIPVWLELIQKSFLKDELKEKYFKLLEKRIVKFFKT